MFTAIIIVAIIICIIEGIPLVKKKLWKELITVMFLIFIAIFLSGMKALNIFSPVDIFNNYIYPLGRKIFRNY